MVLKDSSSTISRSSRNCTAEIRDWTVTKAIKGSVTSELSDLHFPNCLLFLQDLKSKRNPRLVPYVLLDDRTKKSNRDSLREAIRTLIGYGYNIEPSDQEGSESHAFSSH